MTRHDATTPPRSRSRGQLASRHRPRGAALVAGAAALTLVAASCSGSGSGSGSPEARRERELPELTLASALTPFDSCDALLSWVKAEASSRVGPYGLGGDLVRFGDDMASLERDEASAGGDTADVSAMSASPASGGDGGSSGTNVQVEGVDEPDVVKADGGRIVTVTSGVLQLVDTTSEPPRVLDTLELADGYGSQLLMQGDRLLVLSTGSYATPAMLELGVPDMSMPAPTGSTITEIDLAGDELRKVDEITIEGAYVSARMIGDVVRIVVHSDPQQRLGFVQPSSAGAAADERATAVNRDVIDASTLDDWLPHWTRGDGEGPTDEGTLVDCANTHRPPEFSGFGVLSVLTVDLSEGLASGLAQTNASAVMAGGETVYASPSHLFVATTEWVDWAALSPAEQASVDRDYGTDIHRFDISSPDRADYEVSGRVDGRLLNQFALDEHEDVLRVATTKGSPWGEDQDTTESQVVTLAERDGELVQVGAVGGLGKGETIRSVRFMGPTAYVVTFRQTDPLYTLDLTDPAAPRMVGELKILGYSAYLHPVGDGLLLGIGQDATDEGQTTGLQVSLFDVRDPAAPQRIAQATVPGASSEAEWDHHAFLWWSPTGLAMIPVNAWNEGTEFNGAIGFTVDTATGTVAELGRVTHQSVSQPAPMPIEPGIGGAEGDKPAVDLVQPVPEPYTWTPPIQRSLVIDGALWTVSETGLLRSDLTTLAPGPWVPFTTP